MEIPLLQRIRELIDEQLFDLADDFLNEDSLIDEGLDSMAFMQLILLLEKEFEIKFLPEDLGPSNFETIAALKKLIEERRT